MSGARARNGRRTITTITMMTLGGLLGAACPSTIDVEAACDELVREVALCDVTPRALACGDVSPEDADALLSSLVSRGCDGLWSPDTREVDHRACDVYGWRCPAPLGALAEATSRARIVLVGGIDARAPFGYRKELVDGLRRLGWDVHEVKLPSWAPRETRSRALTSALAALRPHDGGRLHLFCYAVGGLDCRYAASPTGLLRDDPAALAELTSGIASITTIATPHLGTNVAAAAIAALRQETGGDLLRALLGATGPDDEVGDSLEAVLLELTNERTSAFSRDVVDAPSVRYRSIAAVSHVAGQAFVPSEASVRSHCEVGEAAPLFAFDPERRDSMSDVLVALTPFSGRTLDAGGAATESPSDGMISVESAKWGEFRGCVPADHYDVIGQLGDGGADPTSGFDALRFYATLAAEVTAEAP